MDLSIIEKFSPAFRNALIEGRVNMDDLNWEYASIHSYRGVRLHTNENLQDRELSRKDFNSQIENDIPVPSGNDHERGYFSCSCFTNIAALTNALNLRTSAMRKKSWCIAEGNVCKEYGPMDANYSHINWYLFAEASPQDKFRLLLKYE
ncbi:MAG: hypothetical protein WBI82_13865 [Sphaerochaeta sp.]